MGLLKAITGKLIKLFGLAFGRKYLHVPTVQDASCSIDLNDTSFNPFRPIYLAEVVILLNKISSSQST